MSTLCALTEVWPGVIFASWYKGSKTPSPFMAVLKCTYSHNLNIRVLDLLKVFNIRIEAYVDVTDDGGRLKQSNFK